MPQTIRITITPDLERALKILRKSTLGTLNTTELIKMAVGSFAHMKTVNKIDNDLSVEEWDKASTLLFHEWAKEDGSLEVDNISPQAKLKPFVPDSYVPNR